MTTTALLVVLKHFLVQKEMETCRLQKRESLWCWWSLDGSQLSCGATSCIRVSKGGFWAATKDDTRQLFSTRSSFASMKWASPLAQSIQKARQQCHHLLCCQRVLHAIPDNEAVTLRRGRGDAFWLHSSRDTAQNVHLL
jgi:hypothetical protein